MAGSGSGSHVGRVIRRLGRLCLMILLPHSTELRRRPSRCDRPKDGGIHVTDPRHLVAARLECQCCDDFQIIELGGNHG
jgi:hypothetical protein